MTSGCADLGKHFGKKNEEDIVFSESFLILNSVHFFAVIKSRHFVKHASKRMESVIKVMTSSSLVEYAGWCIVTDGCYAVNFKHQNKSNCELTSGLSEDDEMIDDVNSDLYLIGQ